MKRMIKAFNEYMKKAKQESAKHYSVPAAQPGDELVSQGWIGVDLDGTLANFDGHMTLAKIGEPVPKMAELVHSIVRSGVRVKIFTARAGDSEQVQLVKIWLRKHGFPDFEVTNVKDYDMIRLYDDRAVQVIANTGEIVKDTRSLTD